MRLLLLFMNCVVVKMSNLKGSLAQSMIPISIPNWKNISDGLKDNMRLEIKVIKGFSFIIYFYFQLRTLIHLLKNVVMCSNIQRKLIFFWSIGLGECGDRWQKFKYSSYKKYAKLHFDTPEIYEHSPVKSTFITQEI